MILQSLCDYYDRKASDLAPYGFEKKEIPFLIVIDENGKFVLLEDTRETHNKKLLARVFTVPRLPEVRKAKDIIIKQGDTSGIAYDHFGYVLGQPNLDTKSKTYLDKDHALAKLQNKGFKIKLNNLKKAISNDPGLDAILKFYEDKNNIEKIKKAENWKKLIKKNGTLVAFRLSNNSELVCQSKTIIAYVTERTKENTNGICIISGQEDEISRTHNSINNIGGTNPKIVSFNKSAFESYKKSQSYNSPVGKLASFKYTTALNHLLRKVSPTKFQITETSYVCWAEKKNKLEQSVSLFLSEPKDDPDAPARAVKELFKSIHNGAYQDDDGSDKFYVLGLSPNSARIVVRFWKVGTIAEYSENFARWFNDLNIVGLREPGYPSLKQLLRATALQYKDDNIPPNLPAEVIRSIMSNTRLPETLIQAVLRRIKAERGHVTDTRACLIKAYLNRKFIKQEKITVSLNKDEKRIGYNLGRLFAVLEKLQLDAQPGINATIRDRYYSSASITPNAVFGTLMRLSTHHIKKLERPEYKKNVEKRIGEVMELINDFPSHLKMEDQGLFAIGYYHQKQDFYKKNVE